MSEYLMLFKWQFKNNYRLEKTEKKERKKKIALYLTLAIGMAPLLALVVMMINSLTPLLIDIGIFTEFLAVILGSAQLVVFIFGLSSIMAHMFFSKDNEFLASLPLKSSTIFYSKLSFVYLSELFISFIVVVPTLITAGVSAIAYGADISPLYFILIPLVAFLSPAVPLFLIVLLSTPMMYIVSFFKKRATLSGLIAIVIFVGVMALYMFFVNSFASNQQLEDGGMEYVLIQISAPIVTAAKLFIFNQWIINVLLLNSVLVNLALYLALAIVIVVVSTVFANKLYKRGLTADLESSQNNNASKSGETLKKREVSKAIMLRDLKMVLREPSLAFNSFMGPILSPILIFFITMPFNNTTENNFEGLNPMYLPLLLISFVIFYSLMIMCGTNYFANIAISREGDKFYINKYLPIDFKMVIKGKLKLANAASMVGVILITIITFIAVKDVHFINVLFMGASLLLFTMGFNYFGFYRDLKKPKLKWTNLNQVIKQNVSVLLPMILGLIMGGVLLGVAILFAAINFNYTLSWVILWAVAAIQGIILLIVYKNKVYNLYNEIIENIEC